jgi:hypothetical protein
MEVSFSMVRLQSWMDGSIFTHILSDAQTRAAIHAPTSKEWVGITPCPFAPTNSSSEQLFLGVCNELMRFVYS